MAKRSARTTKKQLALIVDFIEQNNMLAQFSKVHPNDIDKIEKKWIELGNLLNSSNLGPAKTVKDWKKVFSELKTNTKRKARELKVEQTGTGGGKKKIKDLTEIEDKILKILSNISIMGATEIPEPGLIPPVNTESVSLNDIDLMELEVVYVDNQENEKTPTPTGTPMHQIAEEIASSSRTSKSHVRPRRLKSQKPQTTAATTQQLIDKHSQHMEALTGSINSLAGAIHSLAAAILEKIN